MKFLTLYNKNHISRYTGIKYVYLLLLILIIPITISCSNSTDSPENNDASKLRMTFAVTDISVGKNRIAFAILDPNKGVIIPESLDASTYYLDGEIPNNKIETLETTFREWPNGKGVYTTNANFTESGRWGIGINLFYNNEPHKISASIIVTAKSKTPPIDSQAPIVETRTYSSFQKISEITSAPIPHIPLYKISLKDSLESKTPTIILFATPAFCQTGTCGPQLDIIKNLSLKWHDEFNFIHSEIYSNLNELDGDISNAKISKAATAWNLPSEPWTFVIDSSGKIVSKFEGFTTEEELEKSIKSILDSE